MDQWFQILGALMVLAGFVGAQMRVLPTDAAVHEAVAVLHERCFPRTYLSGEKLVDGSTERTVVVAMGGSWEGVLACACGVCQSRSSSLRLVLERVWASTVFTMTAQ